MRQRKLREGKKYSPHYPAWAEAEAVGESRVLPGGQAWELQGGLQLSLSCCVTVSTLPPSLNLELGGE